MANPYHHALSCVKVWGGTVEDYIKIHDWFDASKEHFGDFRHRALRHHSQGIYEAERLFGGTDHTILPIKVQLGIALGLTEGGGAAHIAGGCLEEGADRLGIGAGDVPAIDGVTEGFGMHGRAIAVDQAAAIEFADALAAAPGIVKKSVTLLAAPIPDLLLQAVPLSSVADIEYSEGVSSIKRNDRNRVVTIGPKDDYLQHEYFSHRANAIAWVRPAPKPTPA